MGSFEVFERKNIWSLTAWERVRGDKPGWWEWATFSGNEGLYRASADEGLRPKGGGGITPKTIPFARTDRPMDNSKKRSPKLSLLMRQLLCEWHLLSQKN